MLIHDAAYKTLNGVKPSCIMYFLSIEKVNGNIRKHDSTKHLAYFYCTEKYEIIFDSIIYLAMLNIVPDVYSHKSTTNNFDGDLPLEKTINAQNVVILFTSFFDKSNNHYYYETLLEKNFHLIYKMLHYDKIEVSEGIDVNMEIVKRRRNNSEKQPCFRK